jgi:WD40 repeat protein
MKRFPVLLCVVMLIGCGAKPTFESEVGEGNQTEPHSSRSSQKVRPAISFIDGLAFSPDKTLLYTRLNREGGEANSPGFQPIKLWDVKLGREFRTINDSETQWLEFLPDSKHAVSQRAKRGLAIWDVRNSRVTGEFQDSSADSDVIAISSDGAIALSRNYFGKGGIQLLDIAKRKCLFELDGKNYHKGIFTPDGASVYALFDTSEPEFAYRVWDVKTGRVKYSIKKTESPLYPRAFSPDGKWAVAERPDKRETHFDNLILYETGDPKIRKPLLNESGSDLWRGTIKPVIFSGDGKRVLAIDDRGDYLWSWDTEKGTLIRSTPLDKNVRASAFTADGELAVTAAGEDVGPKKGIRLRIWETSTGKVLFNLLDEPKVAPLTEGL